MENLEFATQVFFLGFFTVLLTLFALYGVILLFNRIFYRAKFPDSDKAAHLPPAVVGTSQPASAPSVVAAITAAVCAYLGDQNSLHITVQRSHRPAARSWAAAGRKMQLSGRSKLELLRRKKLSEKI